MAMLLGTTWAKRSPLPPPSLSFPSDTPSQTQQTLSFNKNETTSQLTFIFNQQRMSSSQNNRNKHTLQYEGTWELLEDTTDLSASKLIFHVTSISEQNDNSTNPGSSQQLENKYRLDCRQFMERNRREQSQIRKQLNTQQGYIERSEMDLGRPGRDAYLRQQQFLARKKITPKPTPRDVLEEKITLCDCVQTRRFAGDDLSYYWWCLQCKTTECVSCTKGTCWIGMDYDHDDVEIQKAAELAEIESRKVKQTSCRVDFDPKNPNMGRPDYYEILHRDFKCEYKILASSTVLFNMRR